MEAQVAQFIAFLTQQVGVVIYLRGVDLVVQLHLAYAAGLHLVLTSLDLGAQLGAAAALLLAVAGFGGLSRLLGSLHRGGTTHQGIVAGVEHRLAVLKVEDGTGQTVHQVTVVGDQQQGAGVGHQRFGQVLAGIDVQVVGGLVQKQQIRTFQHDLRKAQTRQLAAGQCFAGLEHRIAPEAQLCKVAAHLQLGHAGVLVPDDINDPALPQTVLLLGKNAGSCPGAQPHHAAGGTALAVQHLHQGGFACTVGAGNDKPLPAADRIGKGFQQGALPDLDAEVFQHHQLIPRLYVVFKAELQLVGLVLGCLGDLQLFQLLAAALRHFGGGGTHKVAVYIVLQLFSQCYVSIVLLLAQGIGSLLLGQVGRKVALVGGHGLE